MIKVELKFRKIFLTKKNKQKKTPIAHQELWVLNNFQDKTEVTHFPVEAIRHILMRFGVPLAHAWVTTPDS